jgi:hypothetical protein
MTRRAALVRASIRCTHGVPCGSGRAAALEQARGGIVADGRAVAVVAEPHLRGARLALFDALRSEKARRREAALLDIRTG